MRATAILRALTLIMVLAVFSEALLGPRFSKTGISATANYSPISRIELKATPVEEFINSWNRRDIDAAVEYFSENCVYEDTKFAKRLYGRAEIKKHLTINAESLPVSTVIKVDKVSNDLVTRNIGLQWHLEAPGIELPKATRGVSFYTIDEDGLIISGIDVLEPLIKTGFAALRIAKGIRFVSGK